MHPYIIKLVVLSYMSGAPLNHVSYAMEAETEKVKAFQLLAQADQESRYLHESVNGIDNVTNKRVNSNIKKIHTLHGPYFCGSTQLKATTVKSCKKIVYDVRAQYKGASLHLHEWFKYCEDNGHGVDNVRCAITGYAGGGKATTFKGKAWRYAGRIIKMTNSKGWSFYVTGKRH